MFGEFMELIYLVHGMADRSFLFRRSFSKIKKFLVGKGYKVYVSKQDALGSIERNAIELEKELEEILEQEDYSKVTIIAHSKGGLDARAMLHSSSCAEHVDKLITLATPHNGSYMAETILNLPKFVLKIISIYWNLIYKILGDKKPNLYKVTNELTPKYLEDFNKRIIDNKNVKYYSYSAQTISKKGTILMFIPKIYQRYIGQMKTDGIVEEESAKHGMYMGSIDCDHHELAGFMINSRRAEYIKEVYLRILAETNK